MKVMISIIVPMYNVAHYIARCADSLFKQTYPDIEFIFVDDGSTDTTLIELKRVLENYSELKNRTSIIALGSNSGVAIARQKGIDASIGEFVAFIDADDYVPSDFIKNLYQCALKSELDIAICDHIYVYANCEVRIPTASLMTKDDYCASLMTGIIHAGFCNKLIKKQLFVDYNLRFSPELMVLEDKAMMVKLFEYATNIGYCADTVYYYNKTNESSLTSRPKAQQAESLIQVWDEIGDFYRDKSVSRQMTDAIEFFRIAILASLLFCLNNNDMKKLKQDLSQRPKLIMINRQPVIPINNKVILLCYSMHLDWAVSLLKRLRRFLQD